MAESIPQRRNLHFHARPGCKPATALPELHAIVVVSDGKMRHLINLCCLNFAHLSQDIECLVELDLLPLHFSKIKTFHQHHHACSILHVLAAIADAVPFHAVLTG
jgi:hypothetical protein